MLLDQSEICPAFAGAVEEQDEGELDVLGVSVGREIKPVGHRGLFPIGQSGGEFLGHLGAGGWLGGLCEQGTQGETEEEEREEAAHGS